LNVKPNSLSKGVNKFHWLLGQSPSVSYQGRRALPEFPKITSSARKAHNQFGPRWLSWWNLTLTICKSAVQLPALNPSSGAYAA